MLCNNLWVRIIAIRPIGELALNENFGIAIVEALQNNLPVLITKDVYIYDEIIKIPVNIIKK